MQVELSVVFLTICSWPFFLLLVWKCDNHLDSLQVNYIMQWGKKTKMHHRVTESRTCHFHALVITVNCFYVNTLVMLIPGGGTELRFFSLCGNSANHHATTEYQQSANKKCIKSEWYVVWNMQTIVQMKTALLKVVHLILIMVCMLWAWELLQRTSVLSTQYFFPCLKLNKWMKKKASLLKIKSLISIMTQH